jgi:NitT/TauT family transport system permease protein
MTTTTSEPARTLVHRAARATTATMPTRPPMRARLRRLLRLALPPAGVFATTLGIWYAITYLALDKDRRWVLPAPHEIIRLGFLDEHNLNELLAGLGRTIQVSMMGLGISIALGVGVAVVMSQAKWLELSLFPWAVLLQTIPILALVGPIGIWIGFGLSARVLVCVLISLFPIISNTLFGLQSAEAGLHDLFRLRHAGRLARLRKLLLPASLPSMFAGFRISAGLSVIGAIVGDFFFRQGTPGLGNLLNVYSARLETERMFAAVLLASLYGVAMFVIVGVLSRRVVGRWYHARTGQ